MTIGCNWRDVDVVMPEHGSFAKTKHYIIYQLKPLLRLNSWFWLAIRSSISTWIFSRAFVICPYKCSTTSELLASTFWRAVYHRFERNMQDFQPATFILGHESNDLPSTLHCLVIECSGLFSHGGEGANNILWRPYNDHSCIVQQLYQAWLSSPSVNHKNNNNNNNTDHGHHYTSITPQKPFEYSSAKDQDFFYAHGLLEALDHHGPSSQNASQDTSTRELALAETLYTTHSLASSAMTAIIITPAALLPLYYHMRHKKHEWYDNNNHILLIFFMLYMIWLSYYHHTFSASNRSTIICSIKNMSDMITITTY